MRVFMLVYDMVFDIVEIDMFKIVYKSLNIAYPSFSNSKFFSRKFDCATGCSGSGR